MLAAGDLDPTFDLDGWVSASFEASDDVRITSMAVQNDGKIVIAGQFNNPARRSRRPLQRQRHLDTTFGDNDGLAATHGSPSTVTQSFAEDITIDNANGDIYLVGRGANLANTATGFAVMRLDSDGELDASFGTGGIVVTHFAAGPAAEARGVALQSDGKIVVVGVETKTTGTRTDFAVARYNRDGSLDTTFDGDGKVITDFTGTMGWTRHSTSPFSKSELHEKILVSGYSSRPVTFTRDLRPSAIQPGRFAGHGTRRLSTPWNLASAASTTPIVAGTDTSIGQRGADRSGRANRRRRHAE